MPYVCYAVLIFTFASTSCVQTTKAAIYGIKRGVVPSPSGDYDLNALEVIYAPERIEVGNEVIFKAFYDNRGNTTVPKRSFHAELLINERRAFIDYEPGPVPKTMNMREIIPTAAGNFYQVGFKPTEPGTYHYKFVLDRADHLPETDERNNVVEGTFVVIGGSGERY